MSHFPIKIQFFTKGGKKDGQEKFKKTIFKIRDSRWGTDEKDPFSEDLLYQRPRLHCILVAGRSWGDGNEVFVEDSDLRRSSISRRTIRFSHSTPVSKTMSAKTTYF
jgi:hypothetical protein